MPFFLNVKTTLNKSKAIAKKKVFFNPTATYLY